MELAFIALMMSIRHLLIAWFAGIVIVALGGTKTDALGQETPQICRNAINHVATRQDVPAVLMRAIAVTESGRWDNIEQASVAWPWTVTAEGKGQFLPSKAAAIAEVRALQARGIRNIDVGCMQINLQYHPDAFSGLDAAFDPVRNATYAAGFLNRLKAQTGAWWTAVGRYHSATPRLASYYQSKVAARLGGGAPRPVAALPAIATVDRAGAQRAAAQLAAQQAADLQRREAAEARRRQVIAAYLAQRAARGGGAS